MELSKKGLISCGVFSVVETVQIGCGNSALLVLSLLAKLIGGVENWVFEYLSSSGCGARDGAGISRVCCCRVASIRKPEYGNKIFVFICSWSCVCAWYLCASFW